MYNQLLRVTLFRASTPASVATLLFALLSFHSVANASGAHKSTELLDEQYISAVADSCAVAALSESTPGMSVSVVQENQLVFDKGYGVKSANSAEPVDAQTLFRTGSTQKMMTAAAVLSQVDNGNLRLNHRLSRYVPDAHFNGRWNTRQIRVKHLLDHSSAIPTISEYDINCGGDDNSLTAWAGSLYASGVQLLARPGRFHNYSNAGYSMAGLVAERAAGVPYRHLIKSQVWEPAGMHNTFQTTQEAMDYGNTSQGHLVDPESQAVVSIPANAYECHWTFPAGDAFTTSGDMARWSIMLMSKGGQTLSPESAEKIISPSIDTLWMDEDQYGYGTYIKNIEGRWAVYHGGSVPGWNASQIMLTDDHFSVSVLSNGGYGAGSVAVCITEQLQQLSWPGNKSEVTPPETWTPYLGFYLLRFESGESAPAFVYRYQDKLFLYAHDPINNEWRNAEMQQLHKGNFFVDIDGDGELSSQLEPLTFIQDNKKNSKWWLRNTLFVGEKKF